MNKSKNKTLDRVAWLRNAVALLLLCVATVAFGCTPKCSHKEHSAYDVVLLGDSNTWLGKDDCSGDKGWSKWFAESFRPHTIRSYARSGATWTNTINTQGDVAEYTEVLSDDNVIYTQVLRLVADFEAGKVGSPELVIISAGTNDAWFINRRPQSMQSFSEEYLKALDLANAVPSAVLTMQESIVMCCSILRAMFADVEIVLLTPMQTVKVSDHRIEQASRLIEKCGKAIGCHIVRLDEESCVRSAEERVRAVYTYDGTHTSERGAQCNGELVARKICEMICNSDN